MFARIISLAIAGMLSLALNSVALAAQGSGCMPTTGTVSGLSFAQLVNQAFAAIISSNSGASPPTTDCTAAPVKGQIWLDTSVTPNVEKRYDGNSWVTVGAIDSTNHLWAPPVGGGSASITANATTDICAAPSALQTISGTTTITSFGSGCALGVTKKLVFNGATPITYNATSMILPGQRSFVASPGDVADALYLGSGNWRVAIDKIDGSSVTNPAIPLGTMIYGSYGTIPPKTVYGAGQAISRATYSDYFAAVTRVQTGTLTSGNNTITSVGNTDGLGAGMPLEGTGIQAGTTISSVTSSTIVMSKTATANGSQSIRAFVTGYGSGGDSTTVGVPDCLGRTLAGRDLAGRILPSLFGGVGNVINNSGGSSGGNLPRSALPNVLITVNSSGTANFVSEFGDILRGQVVQSNFGFAEGSFRGTMLTANSVASNFIGGSGTASVSGNFSLNGNVGQTGVSTFQPTLIAECVVVVLQ